MDIKKEIEEFQVLANSGDRSKTAKAILASKLMVLMAISQDETAVVPDDAWLVLDQDARKLALGGLSFVLLQSLDK